MKKLACRKATKAYEAYDKAVAMYDRAKLALRHARRADRVAAREYFRVMFFYDMPVSDFMKQWRKSDAAHSALPAGTGGAVSANARARQCSSLRL